MGILVGLLSGEGLVEFVLLLGWTLFVVAVAILLKQINEANWRVNFAFDALDRHHSAIIELSNGLSLIIYDFLGFLSVRVHKFRDLAVYFLRLAVFVVQSVEYLIEKPHLSRVILVEWLRLIVHLSNRHGLVIADPTCAALMQNLLYLA